MIAFVRCCDRRDSHLSRAPALQPGCLVNVSQFFDIIPVTLQMLVLSSPNETNRVVEDRMNKVVQQL
jgi:hypothetical protein